MHKAGPDAWAAGAGASGVQGAHGNGDADGCGDGDVGVPGLSMNGSVM